jgi:hypothetical protein
MRIETAQLKQCFTPLSFLLIVKATIFPFRFVPPETQ